MKSEASMIKKLKRKFVLLIVVIAALVVTAAFTVVCYADYHQSEEEIYTLLEQSLQEAEHPPHNLDAPSPENRIPQDEQAGTQVEAPRIGGRADKALSLPVAVYYVEKSGLLAFALPFSSADISDDILQNALNTIDSAALIQNSQSSQGKLADLDLYYATKPLSSGFAVAFADASSISWQPLAGILSVVGILVILVVFGVALIFSRWALQPVQNAWDQQQRFIADASHELKTPLTVILANTAILESHPESTITSQRQWLTSTQIEAQRMQGLVEELLQLARFDQAIEVMREEINLSDLVERETLAFEPVAFERQLSLTVDIQPKIMLFANKERLERLCAILLDNACKHGDPDTSIVVNLTHKSDEALLAITNFGSIIPSEDLPHIFDRFYQVNRSRSKEDDTGFGLGLSIAREIMQSMKGSLEVTSSKSEGTTFIARIPITNH